MERFAILVIMVTLCLVHVTAFSVVPQPSSRLDDEVGTAKDDVKYSFLLTFYAGKHFACIIKRFLQYLKIAVEQCS